MLYFSLCCFAAYLLVVRVLRYRRLNSIRQRFTVAELNDMTPRIAQKIVHESFLYDTPMMMLLGTQVALFKVYAIPSIASLLLKTGELKSSMSVSKRLADTATLIATALTNPILSSSVSWEAEDSRSAIAIARMNYLHRKYRIKNEDFLYNLALFMIEPIRWTARFDWRPHSPLEIQAIFVLWTEVGRRMGMQNIWSSYEEMEIWAEQYEEEYMLPNDPSEELSHATINHLMQKGPRIPGVKWLVHQTILTLLDERTREAMRLPSPSPIASSIIFGMFRLRGLFVRYLCLPRRKPALWVPLDSKFNLDRDGMPRMHAVFQRSSAPWYFPEATGWRRTIQNFLVSIGRLYPMNIPDKRWKSEGYRLEELGPVRFENDGHEQVLKEAEAIQGCPLKGVWVSRLPREKTL